MRLRGRQSRTIWASLSVLVIATSILVGCNNSKGEMPAASSGMVVVDEREAAEAQLPSPTPDLDAGDSSKLQSATPESLDADAASEPIRAATPTPASEPIRAATPTPTVQAAPTAVPTPTEETDSEAGTFSEEAILVLEYPDIPAHIQTLKNGERNAAETGDGADAELYPYTTSMTCEDPITIEYVKDIIADTSFQDGGHLERVTFPQIGELFWRFAWKDGSIDIGYPPIVPPCNTRTKYSEGGYAGGYWHPSLHEKPQLYVRTSDENGNWSEVQKLSVPFEVPTPSKTGHWYLPNVEAASNGEHLIFAKHIWGSHVSVWITDDLIEWYESIVPLPPPTDLHPVLITSPSLEQIVAGPNGWMIRVTVSAQISLYELLPDDVAESINWSSRCTFEYSAYQFDVFAYQDGKSGIMVCWHDEEGSRQEIFLPWEDLNMDRDTFWYYGSNFGNKPYLQSPNFSGWVWPGKWDPNENVPSNDGWVQLPYIGDKLCCEVLSTHAGYLALTIPWFAGYSPIKSGTQVLFFSPDGRGWSRVETPEETHAKSDWGTPCEESYWFVESIEDFNGKVLAKAENSHNHWNWDWEARGSPPRRSWIIDPDGTNWRLLDAYECEE